MSNQVMVCGVHCHRGDKNCNGYCTGKSEYPPRMTPEQEIEAARTTAHNARVAAESAWYAYACLCDVGAERTRAFEVYENIRTATRF